MPNDKQGSQALGRLSADFEFLRSELDSDRAALQYVIGTRAWRGRLRGAEIAREFTAESLRVAMAETRVVTEARLTQVAFALAAHKREQGGFPTELSALVPRQLASLPRDSFTSAEFRYVRTKEGYLLYSLGCNGRDDGGRKALPSSVQAALAWLRRHSHNGWNFGCRDDSLSDEPSDADDVAIRFPPPPPPEPSLVPCVGGFGFGGGFAR